MAANAAKSKYAALDRYRACTACAGRVAAPRDGSNSAAGCAPARWKAIDRRCKV